MVKRSKACSWERVSSMLPSHASSAKVQSYVTDQLERLTVHTTM